MYYIGIDLGTTSIKVLLATKDGIADEARAEYPICYPAENWSEQNAEDWFCALEACFDELSRRNDLSKVKAISFSGQMHGLVALDKNDKAVRPVILWNDGRTTEQCDYLNNVIGKDKLVSLTGNVALCGFTAPKLLWLKRHEKDNFDRIVKIMLPKDYLAYRLSGAFATDVTDASGTLLFDVKNRRWSEEMLEMVGIKKKQLPAVYESGDVVGIVSKQIATKLHLGEKVKIVIGGGDQAMGAIGAGAVESNSLSVNLGTSGVVFINSDSFVLDKSAALHSFCNANKGYHLMGVTLCCAASNSWWVKDVLNADYHSALAGISALPIDDDLLFLPYLMGERSPVNDPNAKGVFYGINLSHDRQFLTKAVIEGICFSLEDCLSSAKQHGLRLTEANVIGGGAKSADWLQILADVTKLTLYTLDTNEGGALGAVILCAVADGCFSSVEEAVKKFVIRKCQYTPDLDNAKLYERKFAKYKALYNQLKQLR